MQNAGRQSFISGAAVLVIANFAVKLMGALFKIPLQNLIGAEGIGIFSVAYNLYSALFVLATAGLPIAVSKMVSEATALGRPYESVLIVRRAILIFVTIGGVCSCILFFKSDTLVNSIGNMMAYYAVKAIAPSVFFVSVSAVFRGYYQGLMNMNPTAVSQLIEALFKLFLGYGLALFAAQHGMSLPYIAAFAISGVTAGTMFSSLYLCVKYRKSVKKIKKTVRREKPAGNIAANLVLTAVPVAIGASVLSLTNLIDMALVLNRLQDTGFSLEKSNYLFGAYNMSVTLFNLPQTIITAISISIIPAIAAAYAKKDTALGDRTIMTATKLMSLIAFPCAAGMFVLAEPILRCLYFKRPDDVLVAAPLLKILSLAIFFVAAVSFTNAVLQSLGKANVPVITMFVGGLIKLFLNFKLVGIPECHIFGAPIGTFFCYGAIALLNTIFIIRYTGFCPNILNTFLKPLAAASVMAGLLSILADRTIHRFGNLMGLGVLFLVAITVYFAIIMAVKTLDSNDYSFLPFCKRKYR